MRPTFGPNSAQVSWLLDQISGLPRSLWVDLGEAHVAANETPDLQADGMRRLALSRAPGTTGIDGCVDTAQRAARSRVEASSADLAMAMREFARHEVHSMADGARPDRIRDAEKLVMRLGEIHARAGAEEAAALVTLRPLLTEAEFRSGWGPYERVFRSGWTPPGDASRQARVTSRVRGVHADLQARSAEEWTLLVTIKLLASHDPHPTDDAKKRAVGAIRHAAAAADNANRVTMEAVRRRGYLDEVLFLGGSVAAMDAQLAIETINRVGPSSLAVGLAGSHEPAVGLVARIIGDLTQAIIVAPYCGQDEGAVIESHWIRYEVAAGWLGDLRRTLLKGQTVAVGSR